MKKVAAAVSVFTFLVFSGGLAVGAPCDPTQDANCIDLSAVQQDKGIAAGTPLNVLIGNIFTIVFAVAAVLVLAYLIYGAFKWITSGGDKEGTAGARKYIINALVGLAVLALAFVIVRVVGQIVGFNVLESFTLPKLSAPLAK